MATAPLPTSRTESTIPPYLSKRARRKFQELEKKGLFGGFCTFPDNPTPQIILLNCSLSNGLGRQAVYSILQPANPLQVLMPPTSDYSIVTLASTEQAVEVKERCDGKAVVDLLSSQQQSQLLCRTFLSGPKVAVHVVYVRFEAGPPGTLVPRHSLPNGLSVVEGIITKDEELNLLHLFSSEGHSKGFDEEQDKESLKLRRVEHFGYKFEYGSNNVDPNMPLSTPIPNLLCIILKRVLEQKIISCFPDQLTVNEYKPGQGIPPHVDTHSAFEGEIVSLSVGSHCVMDFRRNDVKVSIMLPRRSLMVMSGESRYFWTHGIAARKLDIVDGAMHGFCSPFGGKLLEETTDLLERGLRISFTFRKVKMTPFCDCRHKLCDWTEQLLTQ